MRKPKDFRKCYRYDIFRLQQSIATRISFTKKNPPHKQLCTLELEFSNRIVSDFFSKCDQTAAGNEQLKQSRGNDACSAAVAQLFLCLFNINMNTFLCKTKFNEGNKKTRVVQLQTTIPILF